MPKSLGGTARLGAGDASSLINITHLTSHSDPSIPLVSVFSPFVWHVTDSFLGQEQSQRQHPRPRPSLQVYYTAPDAADPARLESAARALETSILSERHQGRDPDECDRLDVYGMPFRETEGDIVAACIEHQTSEIASRVENKDWYIQRYDVGGSDWRRALVVVRREQEEWVGDDRARRPIGLSVVFYDAVHQEGNSGTGGDLWERRAESVEEEEVLVRELKAELNWQHSASQFDD
ncbi:hypothetical protein F4803DRAFT_203807 [Xylaria telfairii]|nr:hypothetical protein F4803DRAFT_203807 [Xylaria telfairii]